jgi:hypothetical protein
VTKLSPAQRRVVEEMMRDETCTVVMQYQWGGYYTVEIVPLSAQFRMSTFKALLDCEVLEWCSTKDGGTISESRTYRLNRSVAERLLEGSK